MMRMNSTFRPGKRSLAKAYPAIRLMTTVSTTATTAMNTEFTAHEP